MAIPRYSHSAAGVLHIRTIENGSEGSWTTVGNNASLITTGTLPAARLPNHSASLLTSGTIPAARVPTLNQNTTGSAATLTTARTIAGVSFNGSANISLNNNAITNGAGYITSADGGNAATVDGYDTSQSATGSTIVVRDGDGDITGRYFEGDWFKARTTANSALSSSDIDGGGGFVVCHENGWYYHQSASAVRGLLNVANGANNYSFPYTVSSSASNSTVVQRHSSGYIFSNYINTTDNSVTSSVSGLMCKQSGQGDYHRTATAGAVRSFLNVADGATNVTNNNQLTNGAGYITSASANDGIFWENDQAVSSNYTITNGKNAMSAGPITINSGVTVTVGSGENWTIV